MSLDYMLTLTNHEIYVVYGVLKNNVYYEMTPGLDNGGKGFTNMKKWGWRASCQHKKSSTVKLSKKIADFKVKEIGRMAFYDKEHISKVYIPKSIKKIGQYAFAMKSYSQTPTVVVTDMSSNKVNRGYSWWGRAVEIRK